MHELFGMTLYFSDMLPIGYFIIYLPFVLFVIWLVYKLILKRISIASIRLTSTILFSLILLGLPWLDVYRISHEAGSVCKEQGGLHIFKTVEADGFIGGLIEDESKYGFNFTEGSDGKNNKFRWTMVDGKAVKEKISDYKSRYELQIKEKRVRINGYLQRTRYQVDDRISGEVLGELVIINIRSTLLDAFFLSSVGGSVTGWRCGNEAPEGEGGYEPNSKKYLYGPSDLIKAILKPKKQNKGEEE